MCNFIIIAYNEEAVCNYILSFFFVKLEPVATAIDNLNKLKCKCIHLRLLKLSMFLKLLLRIWTF